MSERKCLPRRVVLLVFQGQTTKLAGLSTLPQGACTREAACLGAGEGGRYLIIVAVHRVG